MVDLHLHTDASDGSCTPAELLETLKEAGCTVFAVTDHDTVAGAREMAGLVPEGMRFIPGCEFSCVSGEREYHVLGLGLNLEHPALLRALEHGRQMRLALNLDRIRLLKERYGVDLTAEEIASLGDLSGANKPMFAGILVRRGLAPNVKEAIRNFIEPITGRNRIGVEEAVEAILASGGVPVWAHPLGGESDGRLSAEELRDALADMMAAGIQGLECWYSRYGWEEVSLLLEEAKGHGLLVSGGSDFHGDLKKGLPVGRLNAFGRPVEESDLTVLARL